MPYTAIYFDFLKLREQKKSLTAHYSAQISPNLLALFELIVVKHAQDQAMTVSEAMALQHLASSAALHKRIDDLREAGMIDVIFKGRNRRTKYLVPSEKGIRYLRLMGQLFRKASRTQKFTNTI